MLVMTDPMKIADVRADLRMSQEALAAAAKLSKQPVVNAEKGRPIQRLTAHAILNALNTERIRQGKDPLHLSEIDVNIKGDGERG